MNQTNQDLNDMIEHDKAEAEAGKGCCSNYTVTIKSAFVVVLDQIVVLPLIILLLTCAQGSRNSSSSPPLYVGVDWNCGNRVGHLRFTFEAYIRLSSRIPSLLDTTLQQCVLLEESDSIRLKWLLRNEASHDLEACMTCAR